MGESPAEVRKGTPDDWPALRQLLQEALLVECLDDPETIRERLSQGRTFLAFRGDELVGALQFHVGGKPFALLPLVALGGLTGWAEQAEQLLAQGEGPARQAGAEEWAFVGQAGPIAEVLKVQGFHLAEEVIELEKRDGHLPSLGNREVRVRPAVEEDLPLLVAIDAESFAPLWQNDLTLFRRHLARADFFRVAEQDGAVSGYLVAVAHPGGLYVVRIAVAPAWQGRGIGVRLLGEAIGQARATRGLPVLLNTQRTNDRARRLYQWFGFRPTGRLLWALTRSLSYPNRPGEGSGLTESIGRSRLPRVRRESTTKDTEATKKT